MAIPLPRGSSWPRDWIPASCIAGRFFTIWATREALLCPDGRTEAHAGGSLATRCEHCLPWDWTSDWITMVLKQSLSEALSAGQTACICPTCLSGSVSGTFGYSQIMGPPQKVLLVWDSSHSSTEEAWRNQLQPLKYTLTQMVPFPHSQVYKKITVVPETAYENQQSSQRLKSQHCSNANHCGGKPRQEVQWSQPQP